MFPGYPEFKSTAVFFRLPCDKSLDEVLLAYAICMFVSTVTHLIKCGEERGKLKYIRLNEFEPVRFGRYLQFLKNTQRVQYAADVATYLALFVLMSETAATASCKYNTPILFWGSCFVIAASAGLIMIQRMRTLSQYLLRDSDPGECRGKCNGKFSANVQLLPCGHVPGSDEAEDQDPETSLCMCFACSHAHSECPICKRLVEERKRIHEASWAP